MSTYFSARDRVQAWIKAFEQIDHRPEGLAVAGGGETLLLSDIKTLLEKLAAPCGSCHPCDNYADETWRAAGRKPPHVYEWDGARAALGAVAALVETAEHAAVSVSALRKALDS